jgi:hypothetical protein
MTYRYERKYFLSRLTAEVLKRRVSAALSPDPNSGGSYWVNNLYFDDVYQSGYTDKINGVFSKDKFRARYYNNDLRFIRLEHKHKDGEMTVKRSVLVTPEQFGMMSRGDLDFTLNMDGPVWSAFAGAHRTRALKPAVYFSYFREAFIHEAGNTRVTFDSRIAEETPGLGGVMELKYTHFLPSFISGLLRGMPLTQTAVSKYSMVAEAKRGIVTYDGTAEFDI